MNTSDPNPVTPEVQQVPDGPDGLNTVALTDVPGLPDVATIMALSNEFFRASPGVADSTVLAEPTGIGAAFDPEVSGIPAGYPVHGPAVGLPQTASGPPVIPGLTASSPAPFASTSPVPIPAPPSVPPSAPPVGATEGSADPVAGSTGSQVPGGSSPVPMPGPAELAGVPTTMSAAMGFVAAVPFVDTFGLDAAPSVGRADPTGIGAPLSDGAVKEAAQALGGVPVDPAFGATGIDTSAGQSYPPVSLLFSPDSAVPADVAGFTAPPSAAGVNDSAQTLGSPPADPAFGPSGLDTSAADSPPGPLLFRPDVVPDLGTSSGPFDAAFIHKDFPILSERVHGRPLIWLDNAATTQKPQAVIERLSYFYEHENSNIHRAAHTLAGRATDAYEAARDKVRRFLNASSDDEIVFVRGTTEGINLVAATWGRKNIGEGDEILITWLEHHANIVPWQMLCRETGAVLRVAPVDDSGQVILSEYERLLGPRTKLVAFASVSNALGTVLPAAEMVAMAHRHGAVVLVDGAQSVAHGPTDVQSLDCDFFVFSGHKVFGPTGIGVVYGKQAVLGDMPPWQGGGNMIADVTFERTIYQPPPGRFEAGTGNIADAVGLGTALDYVTDLGLERVAAYEHELLEYATEALCTVPGLCIIGTADNKASVISFVLEGLRNEDVGAALDRQGIAVRAGHHCAQPILRRFGLESTVRPSLALYNTRDEVDALVAALLRIRSDRASVSV
jgi:cysteine desulfurase / selenocysteine lyase